MHLIMNHIKWRQVVPVGILALCLVAAVFVRVREANQLQDKYLRGYDDSCYYSQA